jgi:hypothetical protein
MIDLMFEAAAGELPDSAAGFPDVPTRKLFAVCRALERHSNDGTFYLSCRTAEVVCDFGSHMTASRRLEALVDAEPKILELVDEGSSGTSERWAASYRLARAAT